MHWQVKLLQRQLQSTTSLSSAALQSSVHKAMSTEVYRQTKLGDALVSALEDLLDSGKITPDLAIKVLSEVSIALWFVLSVSSP